MVKPSENIKDKDTVTTKTKSKKTISECTAQSKELTFK